MTMTRVPWILCLTILWGSLPSFAADPSIVLGPLEKRTKGGKYTRFMLSYTNRTNTTHTGLSIQCVGFRKDGVPLGEYTAHWDTRLKDQPIPPGGRVFEEVPLRSGKHAVASVECTVTRRVP